MIFSLDEELHRMSLDDKKNEMRINYPTALYDENNHDHDSSAIAYGDDTNHLSVHPNSIPFNGSGPTHKMRRRSSAYSKFPILTPPHTRRFSITGSDCTANGLQRLSITPVSYTHLDVYKRQIAQLLKLAGWPGPTSKGKARR